ncbi:MAG TPA: hypothetical protein VMA77_23315 [Solirubrobacteraceae bacterium]|nr:hypothetical protein [Solirubrobacteraceae bacterium]
MTNLASTPDETSPHRVVIVACGFAELFAARALRRAPVPDMAWPGPAAR